MQDQIEILKFEPTPEAKHIGIAHIRLFRQVVLRYKVIENKDGSGYFVASPSYKREFPDGTDKWNPWFMLDSQVFSEEVQEMIRAYVNKVFSQKPSNPQSNAFTQQPNQGYPQQQQRAPAPQKAQYSGNFSDDDNVPF